MPFSSCRPPAGLPRSCCRLLLRPGGAAGGSSRGTDGVALGRGAITFKAPNPFGWHRLRPQISLSSGAAAGSPCGPAAVERGQGR